MSTGAVLIVLVLAPFLTGVSLLISVFMCVYAYIHVNIHVIICVPVPVSSTGL